VLHGRAAIVPHVIMDYITDLPLKKLVNILKDALSGTTTHANLVTVMNNMR